MTSLHPARKSDRPNPARSTDARSRRRPAGRPTSSSPAAGATQHLDAALEAAQQLPDPAVASFGELSLPQPMIDVLTRAGIVRPTAIQARTLPDALAGRDVLGRAHTGSGKTLGFGLPMLARLHADRGARATGPRGLVLVPTRELANQVADALTPLAGALKLHVATVVGGASIGKQLDELRRGVDVLVATPGRLLDLMDRRAVRLDAVEIAVLDEADHMADLGFLPAVTRILDATPPNRQCLLFSATLDRGVGKLVTRYLTDPAVHAAGSTATPTAAMQHRVFLLEREDKLAVAAEIGARPARTLLFVRTKHGADRLAKQLTKLDVPSVAIHGNLNQNQRVRALEAFSSGRSRVLVATDVAARGIHIDDLDLVVHFDPPADHKDYQHRSGRTARAGATGTVLSFVQPDQARDVTKLHAAAGVDATSTRVRPGHAAVRAIAESGEPIEVVPEPARPAQARPAQPGADGRPRRRRGAGQRSGAPRSGAGPRSGSAPQHGSGGRSRNR